MHVRLKAPIATTLTTPRNPLGFQGHRQEARKSAKTSDNYPPRSLTARTTSFQPDFKGSWERRLAALVLFGKIRIKNFLLHLPHLEEEVGGKDQGAAEAHQACTGGWGGQAPRIRRGNGPSAPVPGQAPGRSHGLGTKPLRQEAARRGPRLPSQPRRPEPPSYRVFWHP